VIPGIEQIDQRTHNARHQNNDGDYSECPGPHSGKHTAQAASGLDKLSPRY